MSEAYACEAGGRIAAGWHWLPSWAPSPGELKVISKPAGFYGANAGATLAEIDPNYQWWDTDPASNQPYGGSFQGWSTISSYCGAGFNSDTRELFHYGAGHSSMNVLAPFGFSLVDLKWKWFDVPLPFDGYQGVTPWTQAGVEAKYPPEQLNFATGDLNGGWSGWPVELQRPGIIQPIPCHARAHIVHIPGASYGNVKGAYFKCDFPSGITNGIEGATISSHFFDFDTTLWSRTINVPFQSSSSPNFRAPVHDPVSNSVVLFGGTFATSYYVLDVPTKTWRTRTASASMTTCEDTGGHLLHEATGLLIVPAGRTATDTASNPLNGVKFDFWATSMAAITGTGAFAPTKLTVSGSSFPLGPVTGKIEFCGWTYCPEDRCLYSVGGWDGTNKYWKLSPPVGAVTAAEHLAGTWALTEHTFSIGSFVTALVTTTIYLGISQFNRLKWDSRSRAFIWHAGGLTDPVMAFRPEGL